jgi:hypothetical protein
VDRLRRLWAAANPFTAEDRSKTVVMPSRAGVHSPAPSATAVKEVTTKDASTTKDLPNRKMSRA